MFSDVKVRPVHSGHFQLVSFILSSILRSSSSDLNSITCRRSSTSSEQRLKAEKNSSPEMSIKTCSPGVAANSGPSTRVVMRTTWAGRCGSTTAIRFRCCSVSGRIARGTIRGIRVALPASSNCSRCFSSLPKRRNARSLDCARDDNVWGGAFSQIFVGAQHSVIPSEDVRSR